jgi:unsaturated chondroitin disaccharide hydrolase
LKDNLNTHDLGFIFMLSHGLGAQLSGDTSLYANMLQAAANLRRRYNPKGGYLQAWGPTDGSFHERGRIIIDTMMNLPLLYWASTHTGDPTFAQVATQHALTSRLTLIRADNSTAHVADFNPDTGAFLRRDTHQGYHYESCWSRGQAWAVYGFARAYHFTGEEAFRAAAQRTADYTIQHAPGDLVPFWDYTHPDIPHTYRDSSAAAVLASGLLELAAVDPTGASRWQQTAKAIVESLWVNYSSRGTNIPALLLHGSRSVPQGLMDHALIYGDYYFFEALTKLGRADIAARIQLGPAVQVPGQRQIDQA